MFFGQAKLCESKALGLAQKFTLLHCGFFARAAAHPINLP
jgi:hypothetical protein